MTIVCPKCGFENSDNAYWCDNCRFKLITGVVEQKKEVEEEIVEKNDFFAGTIDEKEIPNYNPRDYGYSTNVSFLKIVSFIVFVVIIGIVVVFLISFFSNVGFSWNNYDLPVEDGDGVIPNIEGLPGLNGLPDYNDLPKLTPGFPWDSTIPYWNPDTMDFDGIAVMGSDYWFEGNSVKTSDGWTINMDKRKEFTIDGRLLDMRVYKPNDLVSDNGGVFSPVDLFIGIDGVKEKPDDHPFTTTSYAGRIIYLNYHGEDLSYFTAHSDNNHIIPHNQEVLDGITTLKLGDLIFIEGYITDFSGKKGTSNYRWSGDDDFATFGCQVILVDAITINGQRYPS